MTSVSIGVTGLLRRPWATWTKFDRKIDMPMAEVQRCETENLAGADRRPARSSSSDRRQDMAEIRQMNGASAMDPIPSHVVTMKRDRDECRHHEDVAVGESSPYR